MEDILAQSGCQRDVYDRVLEFLRRSHGRTLREVMEAEIDIADVMEEPLCQISTTLLSKV
jgi:hypothetical protein